VTIDKIILLKLTCNLETFRIIKTITHQRKEAKSIEIPNLTIEEPRQIKTPKKLLGIIKLDKLKTKILHLPE
jgi:hypothetical protein